jgi:hypothetical protein
VSWDWWCRAKENLARGGVEESRWCPSTGLQCGMALRRLRDWTLALKLKAHLSKVVVVVVVVLSLHAKRKISC